MQQLFIDEMQLISLLVTNRSILIDYINESKLIFRTFSSKEYSFFQNEETKKCWKFIVNAISEEKDVKSVLCNQITQLNLSTNEKRKLLDTILCNSTSTVNSSVINKLYLNLKRNVELQIASQLMHSFQNNMSHGNISLLEACDILFMECPIKKTPSIEHISVGENSQIYWNDQLIFNSMLELEQELRSCKELTNIRWILNCSVNSKEGISNHNSSNRIKQIMQDLGLEILNLHLKDLNDML